MVLAYQEWLWDVSKLDQRRSSWFTFLAYRCNGDVTIVVPAHNKNVVALAIFFNRHLWLCWIQQLHVCSSWRDAASNLDLWGNYRNKSLISLYSRYLDVETWLFRTTDWPRVDMGVSVMPSMTPRQSPISTRGQSKGNIFTWLCQMKLD